jgi:hypothetical protein
VRVIGPFLTTLAAMVTIVVGVARFRWGWLQSKVRDSEHTKREALPAWVKRALTGWLVVVLGGLTILFLFIAIKTIVSLSA